MNIAQKCLSRYDSDDFKNDYFALLCEEFYNNEHEILNRISDLFNLSNYETKNYFEHEKYIDKSTCKLIFDFIGENLELFVSDFSGYYVGYTSLESIEFGEQEEQLSGIYNHKTGKEYNQMYLKQIFDKEGYVINKSNPDLAYYVVSGGIHIELLNCKKQVQNIINEQN